ncbi:MAG: NAD(P)-binding protein [bacterium]
MPENIVVGAGLSGLVAAINLAREERNVLVLDRERKIGGSRLFHPSTHITPIDRRKTWEYIGINLDPFFVNLTSMKFHIENRAWKVNHKPIYMVERGDRESSLDTFLYNEALRAGVKFEFGKNIESKSDVEALPPDTIIATGMYPEMFKLLALPFRECEAHIATTETERNAECQGYWGHYTGDYAYTASLNGLLMTLVFNENGLRKDARRKYERILLETERLELKNWKVSWAAAATKPTLFHGKFILTGSIGGWQDPIMFFGIAGAATSGRTAALAVSDRERALNDFTSFTRFYRRTMFARKVYRALPWTIMKPLGTALLANPDRFALLVDNLQKGIPAFRGERYFQKYREE